MDIKRIILSYLDANCYILSYGKKCLIIDPGWDKDIIIKEVGNKKVLGILVTHYHPDHVGALEDIKNVYDAPVFNYKSEEKIMFTGDFLFKGTIGRTDLPTGDNTKMYNSLKMIKEYDDRITLFPGHGDDTTIKYEKENNIFLNN